MLVTQQTVFLSMSTMPVGETNNRHPQGLGVHTRRGTCSNNPTATATINTDLYVPVLTDSNPMPTSTDSKDPLSEISMIIGVNCKFLSIVLLDPPAHYRFSLLSSSTAESLLLIYC